MLPTVTLRACISISFREEYAKLGELRSVVPEKVNFMALTATASHPTRERIFRSLGMLQPKIVYITPQKKNIMYAVKKKEGIECLVSGIATHLVELGKNMPRIIIFCNNMTNALPCTECLNTILALTLPSPLLHLTSPRVE